MLNSRTTCDILPTVAQSEFEDPYFRVRHSLTSDTSQAAIGNGTSPPYGPQFSRTSFSTVPRNRSFCDGSKKSKHVREARGWKESRCAFIKEHEADSHTIRLDRANFNFDFKFNFNFNIPLRCTIWPHLPDHWIVDRPSRFQREPAHACSE